MDKGILLGLVILLLLIAGMLAYLLQARARLVTLKRGSRKPVYPFRAYSQFFWCVHPVTR